MENRLQVFNNEEFGQVRTIMIDNEPWFVGKDVAGALGYKKTENAIANHVDNEDKTTTLIQGDGSNYKSKVVIINESGVYALIFGSKLISAKKFKRWVTSEVLPSIRKTGGYVTQQALNDVTEKITANVIDSVSEKLMDAFSEYTAQFTAWNVSNINKLKNDIETMMNTKHEPISYDECVKPSYTTYLSGYEFKTNRLVTRLYNTGLYDDRCKVLSRIYSFMNTKRGIDVNKAVDLYCEIHGLERASAFKVIGEQSYLANIFIETAEEMLDVIEKHDMRKNLLSDYQDVVNKIRCDGYKEFGCILPLIYKRVYKRMRDKYNVVWNKNVNKSRTIKDSVELQDSFVRAFNDLLQEV